MKQNFTCFWPHSSDLISVDFSQFWHQMYKEHNTNEIHTKLLIKKFNIASMFGNNYVLKIGNGLFQSYVEN